MSISSVMMMQAAEARRRRDERGRYMVGDQGNNQYGRERRNMDGDMRDRPDMRYNRRDEMTMGYAGGYGEMRRTRRMGDNDTEMRRRGNRSEMDETPDMRGEGYFVWDNANMPYMPPERYGQPHDRQNVTDMRQYSRTRSMMGEGGEKQHHQQGAIGFGEQDGHGKKMTKEKVEKWVKHMRTDGHKGEMWTMEDAKELAKPYGITEGQELIDFYAALNMVYSDYCEVAKEWGVDDETYYAALACAFLYDEDGKAPSEKIAAYYKYVVPHEED